jgi:hypothetical protein
MGLQPWQGGRAAAYLGVPAQAVEEDLSRRERDRIRKARSSWTIWLQVVIWYKFVATDKFFSPYAQSNVKKAQIPNAIPVINTPDTAP